MTVANLGEFDVAAAAEDPDREPDYFTFCNERFTVADRVGILPWARFAQAASSGLDSSEMEGLAALVEIVAQIVVDEDRQRFLNTATVNRADAEDLLNIARKMMEAQAGRPTQQPSDSSDGASGTGPSSKALSPSAAPSGPPTWRDTPFGRRELAVHPELYADVVPISEAGRQALAAEAG